MMSAVTSAENGNEVILLEKMEKLGKKLLITGKEDAISQIQQKWMNL